MSFGSFFCGSYLMEFIVMLLFLLSVQHALLRLEKLSLKSLDSSPGSPRGSGVVDQSKG